MQKNGFYWIDRLPDFNLSKYQAFAVNDIDGLLEQQKTFIRQWLAACELYGLTMHFVMTYSKEKANGKRLDLGLALRGEETDIDSAEPLLFASPLKDYFTFKKNDERVKAIVKTVYPRVATMTKNVRKLPPPQGTNPFWFVPEWEVNDEARLIELIKIMEARGENAAYRVDMVPGDLVNSTREAFKNSMTSMRRMLGFSDDNWARLADERRNEPRDKNAEEALRQFEEWIEKIETTPHLFANVYAFAESAKTAELLLHAAGSEVLEKGRYTVLSLDAEAGVSVFDGFGQEGAMKSALYAEDAAFPEKLRFWAVSYTFEEIAGFVKFPGLYEGEVIQIPKETAADPEETGLLLGADTSGHKVNFPLGKLTKHAFICGVPGGGKTNTMLHLTSTLWKEFGVPFLVLEPAKKEYRALLNDPEMKDVMLFSPNAGTVLPIAINPFEFPLGLTLSEHISSLIQVFSGAFEVMGPVRYYLNKSIETAYYALGWRDETINDGKLEYPILSDIIDIYKREVEASSYDGELKGNLTSFLQVRLGGLMVRELNEIFNIPQSSLLPEAWIETPAVIELEALEQGACNFLILLLCTLIRETLKASPNAETKHGLRHVIFIEEAHNLIAPQTQQQSQETVDPKISATAYIVKMLAEVRALLEGIVIADQLPSAIASEVMKNTGLKIVHRMTAQDDRNMVGSTMSATDAQLEHLGTYEQGDALVFYEGLQLPFRGKIVKWAKKNDSEYVPMGNAELAAIMGKNENYNAMMEDTVNGLILKVHRLNFRKIDETFGAVLEKAAFLDRFLAELGVDSEDEDYDGILSDISERYRILCDQMQECRGDIFAARDIAARMMPRFPRSESNLAQLAEGVLLKNERYNRIAIKLAELGKKIRH